MKEGEHIPKIMRLRRIELTPNEHAVLEQVIKDDTTTFKGISKTLKLSGPTAVNYFIGRLVIKGYLTKTPNRRGVKYLINKK